MHRERLPSTTASMPPVNSFVTRDNDNVARTAVGMLSSANAREVGGLDFQTVFLLGAPRSGTTWVQQMLGAHPDIATPQETDLFSGYIESWRRIWSDQLREAEEDWRERRFKGLPSVLTQDEFDDLIYGVIAGIYRKVMDLKPSATKLLDKDPPHSLYVDLIRKHLPDARFIHLVRDGRDVVTSLIAASKGWGRSWAPKGHEEAVQMWKAYVLAARRAELSGSPYIEVRYEDLLADGSSGLKRLFDFCLVEVSLEDCSEIYERFARDSAKSQRSRSSPSLIRGGEVRRRFGAAPEEPEGFLGKATRGGWKETWGSYERWCFDHIAGDLLEDLGYVDDEWAQIGSLRRTVFSRQEAARLWLRQLLRRAKNRLSAI